MEDFGYQKDGSQDKLSNVAKKSFLLGATLFSITCFIYITINAYYFVYQEKDSNIEVIKAKTGPIKVLAEDSSKKPSMQINHSIYEDIFGNNKAKKGANKTKVRNIPKPALPPKIDRRLIKESRSKESKLTSKNLEQKIIVYSDSIKNKTAAKDLLTKVKGKKTASARPTRSKKRSVRVQVAAMTSRNAAQKNWNNLNRAHSGLFSGLKPFIEKVNLGKRGIFFRLQIGNFYNQVEAEEFCNRYVAKTRKSRADCIIVE